MEKKLTKTRRTKEMITKAAREVYALTLRGTSQTAISKEFNITTRQVQRYVRVVREYNAKNMTDVSFLGKISEYNEKARFRISKLWNIILGKETTNEEKIRAIKELRHEDTETIKREQMVGILPKEASPLISVESTATEGGDAENKVQINIIAPNSTKKIEGSGDEDPT